MLAVKKARELPAMSGWEDVDAFADREPLPERNAPGETERQQGQEARTVACREDLGEKRRPGSLALAQEDERLNQGKQDGEDEDGER